MNHWLDKVLKRHRWTLRQKLMGCAVYGCEYCWDNTWKGDGGLVPMGIGRMVYSNQACKRDKS